MGAKSTKVIVLNGQTYRSIEEMPPDVREKYELAMCLLGEEEEGFLPDTLESRNILADRNRNGIPDLWERITADQIVVDSTKVIVDGKEFDHIEDLPPAARARYDEAMRKLDSNRNGIPDFIERTTNTTNRIANISTNFARGTPPSSMSLPADSTIEPDTSNRWMLTLGLFSAFLCVAGAVGIWYFFLR